MAKIQKAEILGLAGRSDIISVTFNPDLNVFWGLNGSGKTSFLKILHSALTGDSSSIVRVPFQSASVTFESNDGVFVREIRKASLRPSKREMDLIEQLAEESDEAEKFMLMEMSRHMTWKTVPETPVHRRFRHGYLPISRMTDFIRSPHSIGHARRDVSGLLNEAQIDEEFARQTIALWREYSNQALTRIRRAQEQGLAEVLSAILTGERSRRKTPGSSIPADFAYSLVKSFFQQQRISPVLSSQRKFEENYENNALLRDVVARIAEVENSIRKAQEPQRRLSNLLSSLFAGSKEIILDSRSMLVKVGEDEIPIESLSSGEKQIIRLLLECLAAEDHCILIDEPELSLHVDWQHQLVESMRLVNRNVQLILATHSPEVMAEIPVSAVFEL